MERTRLAAAAACVGLFALIAGACGTDEPATQPTTPPPAADDGDGPDAPDIELEDRVVVAGSGGAFREGFLAALEPWVADTGVQIDWVEGLATEHTGRIVAQAARPEIDLLQAELVSHYAAAGQNIFAPFDPEIVTNLANWPDEFVLPDGTAINITTDAVGLMWNEDELQGAGIDPPQSWEDFDALLQDERLRNRVALPHIDNGYMRAYIAVRLKMMGADQSDPTPVLEDLAAARDWVYEYPRPPAALADLFTAGQVWLAVNGQSRIVELPAAMILAAPTPLVPHSWSLIRNGPSPNAAQSLVNYLISEEGQRRLWTETQFSPIRPPADVPDDPMKIAPEDLANLETWDYELVQQSLENWREVWARMGFES